MGGNKKIWLDPNELEEIGMANTRQNIRKLIRDGFIFKKSSISISTFRKKKYKLYKKNGRHKGFGKRKGTKESRFPKKIIWMRRQRVLRRLLKKYRDLKKIDKYLYHELYLKCKGDRFKNKNVLIDYIHRSKNEKGRIDYLTKQLFNRKKKVKINREKKETNFEKKLNNLSK